MPGNHPIEHDFEHDFAVNFHQRHPSASAVMELFRYLPGVLFYAKDHQHRYVEVNPPVLRDVFGLNSMKELLGRTDADFQPPALATAYHAEDTRVMELGRTIANQVWLVPHVRGTPCWYKSTKTPLRNPSGDVIGLAGVMYPIATPEEEEQSFRELAPVIAFIDRHSTSVVSMEEMAKMAGLSRTHFNQRFRELLRMSPSRYLLARRIEHARRLLSHTDETMASIAAKVGFYDQSHFTKKFRLMTGITPTRYRQRFDRDSSR